MKTKYLILTALISLIALPAAAQEKLLEASQKKRPSWVGITTNDYFSVSITAPTLEQAQKKALDDIKNYILTSIATNIISEQSSTIEQTNKNNVIDLLEKFTSTFKTQGPTIPFLTDISLSNAEDVYWEKYSIKKENRTFYNYNVKYGFPETERQVLIDQFLNFDKEQYSKYEALQAALDTFTSIEDIEQAVENLNVLNAYFFDPTRKSQVTALQNSYRKQYANITVMPIDASPGQYDFCLMLSGRVVTTAKKANLKSNCASNISCVPVDNHYRITYKDGDCRDDENNSIELKFAFSGSVLSHTIPLDVELARMQVTPVGNLSIAMKPAANDANQITVNVTLRSKYDSPFTIEQAVVTIPEMADPIDSGAINQTFSAKGNHTLVFAVKSNNKPINAKTATLTRGYLKIKNSATNAVSSIPLQLPYKISNSQ